MSRQEEVNLVTLAYRAMRERGMEADFPPEALRQVDSFQGPAREQDATIQDLRSLDWLSIDNDDSRDLDQLSVAQDLGHGESRVLVAIADVDALVKKDSPIDLHARLNTTSVYTTAHIFPMLPERLSTDLTSLNLEEDRLAIVIAYGVLPDGALGDSDIFRALVRNKAKLAYHSVTAWLEGKAPMPEAMATVAGIPEQIRLQDQIAQRLRARRVEHGALDLETMEARATVSDGKVISLQSEQQDPTQKLIQDLMIAANGVTATFLEQHGSPLIRRVVRSPERWDRIESLAKEVGYSLPTEPDCRALAQFLTVRRQADPLHFPDLSLAIVKMMGAGEYSVQKPGEESPGHFGLAVRNYSHSTAPNRRYPDMLTQRLLKAALVGAPPPYALDELEALAVHCTQQENAANKVERQIRKSAAALLLLDHIGAEFNALVTGKGPKGTWVRVLRPPVEGKLISHRDSLDVGDPIHVKLVNVDVERGFIDFV